MNDLGKYLDEIVEPTLQDFFRNPTSVRHAYLACLVTYHSIDRVKSPPGNLRKDWGKRSVAFAAMDLIANRIKHVKHEGNKNPRPNTIPLTFMLGFDEAGEMLETRNLKFLIKDAITFIREQTGTQRKELHAAAKSALKFE
jgi:hypothetical protein